MAATFVTTNAIRKNAAGSYTATTLDMQVTVTRSGTVLARERYRVTRSGDTWSTSVTTLTTNAVNAGQLSASAVVSSNSITVTATWNQDGSQASGTFFIVTDGTDGQDGQDGQDGADGEDGTPGTPGTPGTAGYSIGASRSFVVFTEQGGTLSPSGNQTSVVTVTGGGQPSTSVTLTGTPNATSNTVSVSRSTNSAFTVSGISSSTPPVTANVSHTASGLSTNVTFSYIDFGGSSSPGGSPGGGQGQKP